MEISDELIACYIEGTATPEERNFVRDYLSNHPEEYEFILHLMDDYSEDYSKEEETTSHNCISMNADGVCDIAYSAAAFAPMQNRFLHPKNKPKITSLNKDIYERLKRMNSELDDILE